jgi:hypothetical protein
LDIWRGLAILCSSSQNIQTKAAPRPTTIQRNNNVNAGTVSMFNIPDAMPAAYQRMDQRRFWKTPERIAPRFALEVLDAVGVGSSRIPGQI